MNCGVCLEDFSVEERRPKVLPCGHSFCLPCLRQLPRKECPKDRKGFQGAAESLPDNFIVLEICEKPTGTVAPAPAAPTTSRRFWCRDCKAEHCEDEHSVCSLRKVRAERAAPLLDDIQAGELVLRGLSQELRGAAERFGDERPGLDDALSVGVAALGSKRQQLQAATEADEATFQEACTNATVDALTFGAANLLSAFRDAASELSLTLRQPGRATQTVSLKVQQRPAARLLLGQLLVDGELRWEQGHDGEHPDGAALAAPEAPRWQERNNEQMLEGRDLIARIKFRGRVVRGQHWDVSRHRSADGVPPGRGTVTKLKGPDTQLELTVEWDCGETDWYRIEQGFYPLTAVPAWPRTVFVHERAKERPDFLDIVKISSSVNSIMAHGELLLSESLTKKVSVLQGLRCDVSAPWAKLVLQMLAPHLRALCLIKPTADHLRVVKDMPALDVLHMSGVDTESLQLALSMPRLVALEAHCPFASPLGHLQLPEQATLKILFLGVYPLSAALAIIRAHAATLEYLELVAASEAPYGCPDLTTELKDCNLKRLRVLILSRESDNYFCKHDASSCQEQKRQLWTMFLESGTQKAVFCSDCDEGCKMEALRSVIEKVALNQLGNRMKELVRVKRQQRTQT